MTSLTHDLMTGGGALVGTGLATYAVLVKTSPLRLLSRGLLYARAAGWMAVECAKGAAARLDRWPECVERVRREL